MGFVEVDKSATPNRHPNYIAELLKSRFGIITYNSSRAKWDRLQAWVTQSLNWVGIGHGRSSFFPSLATGDTPSPKRNG